MKLKNTENTYGLISKSFHWVMAIIVIGLLAVGLYMNGMEATPLKWQIYGLHKAFGIVVLALLIGRVIWRGFNPIPIENDTHQAWEKIFARLTDKFFYVAMVLMPLSGWAMSSAGGHSVSVFGWFTMPQLVPEDKQLSSLMKEIHEVLGYILIGGIALHAIGALKHHFIDKDSTLRRMLPGGSA